MNGQVEVAEYVELIKRDMPAILATMRIHKSLKTRDEAMKYLSNPGETGNTPRHKPHVEQAAEAVKQVHHSTGTITASKFGTKKDIFKYIECYDERHREVICMSRTSSTWDSYLTAWKCYEQFCEKRQIGYTLPCDVDIITDYLYYMRYEKHLESTTALSYLSALRTLHIYNRMENSQFEDDMVDIYKEGITNDSLISGSTTVSRHVITWEVLQILGFQLHSLGFLNPMDVQVVWLACLLAYMGSMRMGELLSLSVKKFDSVRGISWEKMKFVEGTLVIHARLPKCSEDRFGKAVNFLQYETNRSLCPVFNAFKLIKMSANLTNLTPVFKLSNGKLLTMAKMNSILKAHLSPIFPSAHFTCHSFRIVYEFLAKNNF